MSLEEEIRKLINSAKETERIRLAEEEEKREKERKISEHYFEPIHKALTIAKKEFESSENIIFKVWDKETSYADIDLKNKRDLFRIGISCTPFEEDDGYRISYLMDVRSVYDDEEYYHHYFEQGKETELLKKTFNLIASFEAKGYLTRLDCE